MYTLWHSERWSFVLWPTQEVDHHFQFLIQLLPQFTMFLAYCRMVSSHIAHIAYLKISSTTDQAKEPHYREDGEQMA